MRGRIFLQQFNKDVATDLMKMACDFCGGSYPKYKFPNPYIQSNFFQSEYQPGYFLACIECTILLEDGEITNLVQRTMMKPEFQSIPHGAIVGVRLELAAIYGKVSRRREPF